MFERKALAEGSVRRAFKRTAAHKRNTLRFFGHSSHLYPADTCRPVRTNVRFVCT
jgi:hypothetical protein